MTRRGTYKFPTHHGETLADGGGVLLARSFPCADQGAGVHSLEVQVGTVALVHKKLLELIRIDRGGVAKWRKQDRGLIDKLPLEDLRFLGQYGIALANKNFRYHKVGRGRANVDADATELCGVGQINMLMVTMMLMVRVMVVFGPMGVLMIHVFVMCHGVVNPLDGFDL